MGQALYRKYRSTSLPEIIGQEHITTALETAIKTDRVSHAYLFTGPRGTGKTSIARILAHAINDLPYSTDTHLDIIEIDAASNRRIDEIRDLRDKVYIAPTSAKYKVYIIDEVHMLTREAFNALLKTLEEPPAHVIFILATTDAHKLPETIISRTQRYNFRPVDLGKVSAHLATIAKAEGIAIDDAALDLLAEHGEGSFRDSISMLDQVSNSDQAVTLDSVLRQLGIPPDESITELLATLSANDVSAPVISLQALYNAGYRAPAIAEQLAQRLREQLTDGVGNLVPAASLHVLKQLLTVPAAHNPERYLEIVLMEPVVPAAPALANVPQPPVVVTPKPVTQPKPKPAPAAVTEPEPEVVTEIAPVLIGQTALDETSWAAVLSELKKRYNTVYGIVRMAHTDFSQPGRVGLAFSFAFHQKRISDSKNRKIVCDTIATVTGQQVELVCTLSKDPIARPAPKAATPASAPDKIDAIANVFGGGELL